MSTIQLDQICVCSSMAARSDRALQIFWFLTVSIRRMHMLKKFLSIVCLAVLSTAFVGCEAGAVADKAKDGVDSAAGAAKDAAAGAVPEGAAEGSVDKAGEAAKDAVDSATK